MEPARIRGKVAAILNRRELVLNVGSDDGVQPGMGFAVLNPKGLDIKDPDTQKVIGSVEVPKVTVRAVRVQPRVTVARTFRVTRKNVGGMGTTGLTELFRPPRWVEETETLALKDKPYLEEMDPQQSYVRVGDPVVQILGDEFDESGTASVGVEPESE